MICDRCDRPIEGEPEEIPVHTPTGAAPNLTVHPGGCRAAPRQSTPSK